MRAINDKEYRIIFEIRLTAGRGGRLSGIYSCDRVYDFWSDRRPVFVVFDIFHYIGFCFWKVHPTFKNPVYNVACSRGSFCMVQSCKMLVKPVAVVKIVAADLADKLGRQAATGDWRLIYFCNIVFQWRANLCPAICVSMSHKRDRGISGYGKGHGAQTGRNAQVHEEGEPPFGADAGHRRVEHS
jgi:hypothetical protein